MKFVLYEVTDDYDVVIKLSFENYTYLNAFLEQHTAEKKYKAYLEKVKTYDISTSRKKRIERFINTNLNFLLAEQKSENWDQFLRFSKKLDASRDTNLFDIVPEFKRYE